MVKEVSIIEAITALTNKDTILLDVRTKEEVEGVPAPVEYLWIPLADLASRLDEIPKDKTILALCHHGHRSLRAALFLEQNKIKCANIKGGIEAWANNDKSIKKYIRSSFGILIQKEK